MARNIGDSTLGCSDVTLCENLEAEPLNAESQPRLRVWSNTGYPFLTKISDKAVTERSARHSALMRELPWALPMTAAHASAKSKD